MSCSTIDKFKKEHEEDFKVTINIDDSNILNFDMNKINSLIDELKQQKKHYEYIVKNIENIDLYINDNILDMDVIKTILIIVITYIKKHNLDINIDIFQNIINDINKHKTKIDGKTIEDIIKENIKKYDYIKLEIECINSKIEEYKQIRKEKGEKRTKKITKETSKVEDQYTKRENPSYEYYKEAMRQCPYELQEIVYEYITNNTTNNSWIEDNKLKDKLGEECFKYLINVHNIIKNKNNFKKFNTLKNISSFYKSPEESKEIKKIFIKDKIFFNFFIFKIICSLYFNKILETNTSNDLYLLTQYINNNYKKNPFEDYVIKLFKLFEQNTKLIVPCLLWLDSIHDFSEYNRVSTKDKKEKEYKDKKEKVDKIFKLYIDKIFKKYKEKFKNKDYIDNNELNIEFDDEDENEDNIGEQQTILNNVIHNEKAMYYLFQIVHILPSEFEKKLFFMYLSYFFFSQDDKLDKERTKQLEEVIDKNKNNYKVNNKILSVLWKNNKFLDSWSIDYDHGSTTAYVLNQEKLTYLSSSLNDANKLNISHKFTDYFIKKDEKDNKKQYNVWAGENFIYTYDSNRCMLEVKTQYCPTTDNTLCKKDFFNIISSCDKNELNEEPEKFYYEQNGILKEYVKGTKLLKGVKSNEVVFDEDNEVVFDEDNEVVFDEDDEDEITKLVYIGDSSGPSVNKIFDILIDMYDIYQDNLPLSFIDSMFSLKRVGDFGQIIESKLYNLPFYTDDRMEALISIAVQNTTLTSIHKNLLWYRSENDSLASFLTYKSKYESNCQSFDIQRKDTCQYTENNPLKYVDTEQFKKYEKNQNIDNIPCYNDACKSNK